MSPSSSPLLTLDNSTPSLRRALSSRRVLLLALFTTVSLFSLGTVATSRGLVGSQLGHLGRRAIFLNSTAVLDGVTEKLRRAAGEQGLGLLRWDGRGQEIFEDPELKVKECDSIPRTDVSSVSEGRVGSARGS